MTEKQFVRALARHGIERVAGRERRFRGGGYFYNLPAGNRRRLMLAQLIKMQERATANAPAAFPSRVEVAPDYDEATARDRLTLLDAETFQ